MLSSWRARVSFYAIFAGLLNERFVQLEAFGTTFDVDRFYLIPRLLEANFWNDRRGVIGAYGLKPPEASSVIFARLVRLPEGKFWVNSDAGGSGHQTHIRYVQYIRVL